MELSYFLSQKYKERNKNMEKLKSDIEIIDFLNRLDWITEVIVHPGEIIGKINQGMTTINRKDLNQLNALIDSYYYIMFQSRLICIERFNV
jgi:hypothetical protein